MKAKKRVIPMLLSLLCILSLTLTTPVNAASVAGPADGVDYPVITQPNRAPGSVNLRLPSGRYLSNFSSGFFNYYSQLDSMQKAVYDAYRSAAPTGGDITIQFKFTDGTPTDYQIAQIFNGAYDALSYDCPELYWLKNSNEQYTDMPFSNGYYITKFHPAIKEGLPSDFNSKMLSATDSIRISGSDRYEKVKSIHDALAQKVTYDDAAVQAADEIDATNSNLPVQYINSWDAYGALVNHSAVCQGYAEAFKFLCDKADIPCVEVSGYAYTDEGLLGGHMWNAVQMEDGKWYNVDVTWDDQASIRYDFFLVGSNSTAPAFGHLRFYQSHQANGDFSQTGLNAFLYPSISQESYSSSDTNSSTSSDTVNTEPVTIPSAPPDLPAVATFTTTLPPETKATTAAPRKTTPSEQRTETALTSGESTTDTISSGDESQQDSSDGSDPLIDTGSGSFDSGLLFIIVGVGFIVAAVAAVLIIVLKKRPDQEI